VARRDRSCVARRDSGDESRVGRGRIGGVGGRHSGSMVVAAAGHWMASGVAATVRDGTVVGDPRGSTADAGGERSRKKRGTRCVLPPGAQASRATSATERVLDSYPGDRSTVLEILAEDPLSPAPGCGDHDERVLE
jgi:hypothetical protein